MYNSCIAIANGKAFEKAVMAAENTHRVLRVASYAPKCHLILIQVDEIPAVMLI